MHPLEQIIGRRALDGDYEIVPKYGPENYGMRERMRGVDSLCVRVRTDALQCSDVDFRALHEAKYRALETHGYVPVKVRKEVKRAHRNAPILPIYTVRKFERGRIYDLPAELAFRLVDPDGLGRLFELVQDDSEEPEASSLEPTPETEKSTRGPKRV